MNYIKVGSREHILVIIAMLLGSIVSFAIMYSPQPLISVFSKDYGISPSTASFSISLATIALGFGLLFVSMLSNRWGRKQIMAISLVSTSILAIISAFINDFNLFLVIRFLEGISIAGFPSTAIAYLNEEFDPYQIGSVIGAYVAGTAIGGFFGRVVVGILTDLSSWHFALLILGILNLLFSLWFWIYLPASKHFRKTGISFKHWSLNVNGCFRDKNLICIYAIGFLLMGGYITLLNYIGYPLTQAPYNLSQTIFGFLFAVNLIGIWSSLLFGKLTDKHSRKNVICFAIAILCAGALLTLHHSLIVKVIGVTVLAFGFFAGHAVASGWIGFIAVKKRKAQAASFYLLFYYLGSSVLGWSGGFFLKDFGWIGVVGYISVISLIAIIIALFTNNENLSKLPKIEFVHH